MVTYKKIKKKTPQEEIETAMLDIIMGILAFYIYVLGYAYLEHPALTITSGIFATAAAYSILYNTFIVVLTMIVSAIRTITRIRIVMV